MAAQEMITNLSECISQLSTDKNKMNSGAWHLEISNEAADSWLTLCLPWRGHPMKTSSCLSELYGLCIGAIF